MTKQPAISLRCFLLVDERALCMKRNRETKKRLLTPERRRRGSK
jgi:hypothetical protein